MNLQEALKAVQEEKQRMFVFLHQCGWRNEGEANVIDVGKTNIFIFVRKENPPYQNRGYTFPIITIDVDDMTWQYDRGDGEISEDDVGYNSLKEYFDKNTDLKKD